MQGFDPISVIEAAYALELPTRAWLEAIHDRVAPKIGGRRGTLVGLYDLYEDGFTLEASAQVPEIHEFFRGAADLAPAAGVWGLVNSPQAHTSFSEVTSRLDPMYGRFWREYRTRYFAIEDACLVRVRDGGSGMLAFGGLHDHFRTPDPQARKLWSALAAHLGSGFRLRRALGGQALTPDHGEAVFGSDGEAVHAIDSARHPHAQARLREAVRAIERSRTARGRRDAEGAISSWQPLVDGRWVLIDRFDSDGRRYFVAAPSPRDARRFTRLGKTESRVVGRAARGMMDKAIAHQLDLSDSMVNRHLRKGLRKLGLRSRTELPLLVAQSAPTMGRIGGVDVAIGTVEPTPKGARLTDAEWQVARLAVAGWTDREIATQRQSSRRTVANQLRSAFRKLEVASRAELAAKLAHGSRRPGAAPHETGYFGTSSRSH